jgi:hypothetical protein
MQQIQQLDMTAALPSELSRISHRIVAGETTTQRSVSLLQSRTPAEA